MKLPLILAALTLATAAQSQPRVLTEINYQENHNSTNNTTTQCGKWYCGPCWHYANAKLARVLREYPIGKPSVVEVTTPLTARLNGELHDVLEVQTPNDGNWYLDSFVEKTPVRWEILEHDGYRRLRNKGD